MRREELDKMNAEIAEVEGYRLDAKKNAMRTRGWRRWVYLKFAAFFDWAARLGREIRDDQFR